MIEPAPLILDTNVLIETFTNDDSDSARLLRAAESHSFAFVIPVPVMVELYYKMCELTGDEAEAFAVIEDLRSLMSLEVAGIPPEMLNAILSFFLLGNFEHVEGRIKRISKAKVAWGTLSMADCMVLAVGLVTPKGMVVTKDKAMRKIGTGFVKTPQELLAAFN